MSKSIRLIQQGNPTGSNKSVQMTANQLATGNNKRIAFRPFMVANSVFTSAAVYDNNGNLVKTLWSAVQKDAGGYSLAWGSNDDFGNLAPNGSYHAIVQTNNVASEWQGVIGNTSLNATGVTVHLGYDFIASICISGNRLYYATGYSELSSSQAAFDLNNIQVKIPIGGEKVHNQSCYQNATDGTNVYWAGFDVFSRKSFIYATKVSDNTKVTFANGVSYTESNSPIVYNTIGLMDGDSLWFRGMAVTSQFIFAARGDGNIYVYDKTGLLIRTIAFTNPSAMCVGAADNQLWVVTGAAGANVCAKYSIGNDGSLTATGSSISIANIGAITANSSTLLLCDTDTHQVRAYNISTLGLLWVLGQTGGYANSADVADDKFFFAYPNAATNVYYSVSASIAFQSDGSFWVLDYGNSRLLHFSASRTLIEWMGYLGRFYNSSVNLNNPNRILCDYKEYEIDYTKPLQQGWKLINNYGYNALLLNDQGRLLMPGRYATLNNGKTYTILTPNTVATAYELTNTGIRNTGETLAAPSALLLKDGSYITYTFPDSSCVAYQSPLTGFDGSSNPLWGTPVVIGTTSAITNDDASPNNLSRNQGIETDSGKLVFFDTLPISVNNVVVQDGPHRGYHLAAVQQGATGYQWQTAISTYTNYTGDMPTDGTFDVGNGVNYNAGSCVLVEGNMIIWGYHGEFWKQTQTNIWNMVSDKGLFIGQFGYAQNRNITLDPSNVAPAGMAGNAFAASLVKVGSDLYLYHNDESFHGGLHRWKITGLNTIQETVITI